MAQHQVSLKSCPPICPGQAPEKKPTIQDSTVSVWDWQLRVNLKKVISMSTLRPDIYQLSESIKKVVRLELTVP